MRQPSLVLAQSAVGAARSSGTDSAKLGLAGKGKDTVIVRPCSTTSNQTRLTRLAAAQRNGRQDPHP